MSVFISRSPAVTSVKPGIAVGTVGLSGSAVMGAVITPSGDGDAVYTDAPWFTIPCAAKRAVFLARSASELIMTGRGEPADSFPCCASPAPERVPSATIRSPPVKACSTPIDVKSAPGTAVSRAVMRLDVVCPWRKRISRPRDAPCCFSSDAWPCDVPLLTVVPTLFTCFPPAVCHHSVLAVPAHSVPLCRRSSVVSLYHRTSVSGAVPSAR